MSARMFEREAAQEISRGRARSAEVVRIDRASGYRHTVNDDQRSLIFRLAMDGHSTTLSDREFLAAFGASDGADLGVTLLRETINEQNGEDVELAIIVCSRFGSLTTQHLELLEQLAWADWHQSHEDVARSLDQLRTPETIDALVHLCEWSPAYLRDLDSGHALARKALWGLSWLDDERAREALARFAASDDPYIAEVAKNRISGDGG